MPLNKETNNQPTITCPSLHDTSCKEITKINQVNSHPPKIKQTLKPIRVLFVIGMATGLAEERS